jgi:isocitrate/isopropylmalate dehydrogenase
MKDSYKIVVIGGDGIGPETTAEACKVMGVLSRQLDVPFEYKHIDACGEYFLKTGREWDADSFPVCRDWADAILFGAWGWPDAVLPNGDMAGINVLLRLRWDLDLYANVRPCKLYPGVRHRVHDSFKQVWDPALVDFTVVRENCEGEFVPVHGIHRLNEIDQFAADTRIVTRAGCERIMHYAFQLARKTTGAPGDGVKHVTCVDKSNVYASCKLFRRIFDEVAEHYPDVQKDYAYIDIIHVWLVRNPEQYNILVVPNQFGDIVTDLAAAIQGGMGLAAGANIGDRHGMFEPIHGSAPKYARKNRANPVAATLTAGMMLRWLGERHDDARLVQADQRIRAGVARVLLEHKVVPHDLGGTASCTEVGDALAEAVAATT